MNAAGAPGASGSTSTSSWWPLVGPPPFMTAPVGGNGVGGCRWRVVGAECAGAVSAVCRDGAERALGGGGHGAVRYRRNMLCHNRFCRPVYTQVAVLAGHGPTQYATRRAGGEPRYHVSITTRPELTPNRCGHTWTHRGCLRSSTLLPPRVAGRAWTRLDLSNRLPKLITGVRFPSSAPRTVGVDVP